MSFHEAIEKYSRSDRHSLEKLAAFCGVSSRTPQMWIRGRTPVGGTMVCAMVWFKENGLILDQFSRLLPEVQFLNELFAFKVLTITQVEMILGIQPNDAGYIWRNLLGAYVPSMVRSGQVKLTTLQADYQQSLDQAKREVLGGTLPGTARPLPRIERAHSPSTEKTIQHVLAASWLLALRPMLQAINTEGEASVAIFRSIVGDDEFYAVLDQLKAMSSRKARQFYGV
jgi:hypothetical protein